MTTTNPYPHADDLANNHLVFLSCWCLVRLKSLANILLTIVLFNETASVAQSREIGTAQFDIETLKQRGIDPKLAEYFKEAPRFREGTQLVALMVNGTKKGKIDAHFNSDGNLCFNEILLEKAGLNRPNSKYTFPQQGDKKADLCYDYNAAYPQTSLILKPSLGEIALVVSQDALRGKIINGAEYSSGGTAAIFNYNVLGIRSKFRQDSHDYLSASTQLGFNMGDWIVRSHQMYTRNKNQTRFEHLYAFAQRTFPKHKTILQAGQLNITSPIFGSAPIAGMQLLPESALLSNTSSGAVVQGIAYSRATVEVRQLGSLIYSTMVPEGPFALRDIPILNTNTDLDVTVREVDGAERHFTVPAASFRTAILAKAGYSFAFGKVRSLGVAGAIEPWVATGAGSWNVTDYAVATAGLMAASYYHALGVGVDTKINPSISLSVRNLYSSAKIRSSNQFSPAYNFEKKKGMQGSISISARLTDNLSTSVSATQQSSGYRDLADITVVNERNAFITRSKSQYTTSINWNNSKFGFFNFSYTSNKSFDGYSANRFVASWGKTFNDISVNASIEKAIGRENTRFMQENAFYITTSIPLGSRNIRAYTSNRGDTTRTGATYSERVNEYVNYQVSAERSTRMSDPMISGNVSVLPRYAQMDFAVSRNGPSSSYSAQISGGAVAHKNGITLSPYPIQNTFGIVEIGDISGVKVSTPNGPVWTDYFGQAIIPNLSAFSKNSVQIVTKTLPRQVDLRNGFHSVEAGAGSVNYVDFEIIKAQRLLINTTDEYGLPLPKGSVVVDNNSQFITTVLDDGVIFISDIQPGQELRVALPDSQFCIMKMAPPKETNDNTFFDFTTATCSAP